MQEKEFISFIENLLYEHDCIIIPNFGGFVINTQPFKVQQSTQEILPKKRWVAFNEKLIHDDGFLSNELANHLHIPTKKASQVLAQFATDLKAKISGNQEFAMGIIGTFKLNNEQKIQFSPNTSSNFDAEMFGLSAVQLNLPAVSKPVMVEPELIQDPESSTIHSSEFVVEETSEKSKRKGIKNSVYAFLLFVIAGISTFVLTEPDVQLFTSSLSPIPKITHATQVIDHSMEKVEKNISNESRGTLVNKNRTEEKVEETPKELVHANTIELVAGSFLTEEKAQKGIEELQLKGLEQAYIIPRLENGKYFRISVGSVASLEEGYQKAAEIHKHHKIEIWVFENQSK